MTHHKAHRANKPEVHWLYWDAANQLAQNYHDGLRCRNHNQAPQVHTPTLVVRYHNPPPRLGWALSPTPKRTGLRNRCNGTHVCILLLIIIFILFIFLLVLGLLVLFCVVLDYETILDSQVLRLYTQRGRHDLTKEWKER